MTAETRHLDQLGQLGEFCEGVLNLLQFDKRVSSETKLYQPAAARELYRNVATQLYRGHGGHDASADCSSGQLACARALELSGSRSTTVTEEPPAGALPLFMLYFPRVCATVALPLSLIHI